jgi:hypothetical protein
MHGDVRSLQGREVCVALRDGSRLDDHRLMTIDHDGGTTLWLAAADGERFVRVDDVLDVWPSR